MSEDNRVLRLVYTFFLGILLSIFVGVGISAFYPAPDVPEYPVELNNFEKEPTQEQEALFNEFDEQMRQHEEDLKPYNRNVSILTLGAAVILLIVSLVYEKRIKLIADGVLLGGLFILLYSIGRGFASDNQKYVFLVVSIGLAIVLYLGYHRFVHDGQTTSKNIKNKNISK